LLQAFDLFAILAGFEPATVGLEGYQKFFWYQRLFQVLIHRERANKRRKLELISPEFRILCWLIHQTLSAWLTVVRMSHHRLQALKCGSGQFCQKCLPVFDGLQANGHGLALCRDLRRKAYFHIGCMFSGPSFETRQLVRATDGEGETVLEGHGFNPRLCAEPSSRRADKPLRATWWSLEINSVNRSSILVPLLPSQVGAPGDQPI
jgi:hypothetical protein